MPTISRTEQWDELTARAASWCSPTGFACVTPLPGQCSMAAVGSVDPAIADVSSARAEIGAVLADACLTEGYDVRAVLDLVNAALAVEDLGTVGTVALLTAVPAALPFVTTAGSPLATIVSADGLSMPVRAGAELGLDWTIVLGGATGGPVDDLTLSASDLRAAVGLFDTARAPAARRTLLAVRIERAAAA